MHVEELRAISPGAIARIHAIIAPRIRVTPVVTVPGSDFGLACESVTFKLELLQYGGSFKARGAFTHLLTRDVPPAGVAAASGGNHGVAVAFAAQQLGRRAKIFVPAVSSPAKQERIRASSADLVIAGERYADALAASEVWVRESGALPIHAFDQVETILGQGTLGLELRQQAPSLDAVLVAVGGGGLIAGVASWYAGAARIVGVEPVDAPTLTRALAAGRPVDAPAGSIAADSLAPRRVGELVLPIAQRFVDRVVLVEDDAIRRAQQTLWAGLRIAAEPGGATAFAALLSGAYQPRSGERIGVVVSGGNTTDVRFV